MEAYKTDAVVEEDGKVKIMNLPFRRGEELEVILLQRIVQRPGRVDRLEPYPLRGEPVKYLDPFGSVAQEDWEASN